MIYFLAEFDLELICADSVFNLSKGDIFYVQSCTGQIVVRPKFNSCLESYEIDLHRLNQNKEFCSTWEIGKGNRLVELKPKVRYSPLDYFEKHIEINKRDIKVRYYMQEHGLVQIFFDNNKYQYVWQGYANIECFVKKVGDKEIAFVEIEEKRKYYFIFDSKHLLFQGHVKEINQKENILSVLCDEVNCYGQKSVIEFDTKNDKQERYLVHFDERELNKKIDIKYLFLDAVMIKNKEVACLYLSEELKNMDFELLASYFEEFDDFIFIEDVCLLKKNTEVIKVVHFDIQNNLIINIYD